MKLDEVGSAAVVNAITFLVFKLGSFTIRLPPILAGAHHSCQIHSGLVSTAR